MFALGVGALWKSRGRQAELERNFGNTLEEEVRRSLALVDYQLSLTRRWIFFMLGTASRAQVHGHSAGRWDGETLVVETVGVKDYVGFRNTPHSMRIRITERIRLVEDDCLENQVTIEDPEYLTGPRHGRGCTGDGPATRSRNTCEDTATSRTPSFATKRLRVK